MDHLLQPRNPAYGTEGPPRVPYVCRVPYDGDDFLTYPIRAGKPEIIPGPDKPPFAWLEWQSPSDDKTVLEPFFQTWIFFGLLHELLAPVDLFHAEEYTEADGDCIFVQTKTLAPRLDAWTTKIDALDDISKSTLKNRLIQCLNLAMSAMTCLLDNDRRPEAGHPNFNREIRISLACICETIAVVGSRCLHEVETGRNWPGEFTLLAAYRDADVRAMIRNGWCPSAVAHINHQFPSVCAHWYLRYVRASAAPDDQRHWNCTGTTCRSSVIDLSSYVPSHSDDCNDVCDTCGPSLTAVADCLDGGTFPLLRVSGNSVHNLEVNITPFSYDKPQPYVAISHVWADGMGNPRDLLLPQCKILDLKQLTDGIRGRTYQWIDSPSGKVETRSLLLWCDTLLCPIELKVSGSCSVQAPNEMTKKAMVRSRQLKAAALAKMRDVYQKAAYVLVVDQELRKLSSTELSTTEITARVLTSRWAQRLWTYQEGMLADKLLIQLADGPYDFRELFVSAEHLHTSKGANSIFGTNLHHACIALRLFPPADNQAPNLLRVQGNIARRQASYLADEALCAATVLGFSSEKIASYSDQENRMAILWNIICDSDPGILDNIVFNTYPRLSLPGFRWAPSTFRHGSGRAHIPFTRLDRGSRLVLSGKGARIVRPGWRIRTGQPPPAVDQGAWSLPDLSNHMFMRATDGRWFTVSAIVRDRDPTPGPTIWEILKQHESCFLVPDAIPQGDTHERAILGYSEIEASGEEIIRTGSVVNITLLRPKFFHVLDAAVKQSELGRSDITLRLLQCLRNVHITGQFLFRSLSGFVQTVLPSPFQIAISWPFRRLSQWITARLWLDFRTRMKARVFLSLQSKEIADAFAALRPMVEPDNMYVFVSMNFAGQMIEVAETFGSEREWYVD